jgi:hypothetical protein
MRKRITPRPHAGERDPLGKVAAQTSKKVLN